jgi:SAM-dependent methyltransferase
VGSGFSFERINAADYDALRPDYAPDAVAWVARRCGLDEDSLVVDLGAGTGQLSKRFLTLGVDLVAVEPARNMREVIEDRLPHVRVVHGSAEAIPLAEGAAHAVVVGNAFHHFDVGRAFLEIRRVLRPDGALALFWAWRAEDSLAGYPALRRVEEAINPVRERTSIAAAYHSWERPPARVPGFTRFERSEFPTIHEVPAARLADLYATSSEVASLPPELRADLLGRIREVSRRLPEVLRFPSRTVVDLAFANAAAKS